MSWLVNLIENYGLLGLFINIFLSYSILPTLTVVPMAISLSFFNPWDVFLVSMMAATLGSITNYYIGLKGIRRFFPNSKKMKKAEKMINRWGPWGIVFFSWLPIFGDPMIVTAGTLKMKFWRFMFYSTIAKVWYLGLVVFFGSFVNGWLF